MKKRRMGELCGEREGLADEELVWREIGSEEDMERIHRGAS